MSNRIRVLSDVVRLDAWHTPFTEKRLRVSLHADLTFATAFMGGEKESPARFTVELKCAELRMWIPAGEQVRVIKSSVNRMDPEIIGVQKIQSAKRLKTGAAGSISASVGEKGISPKAMLSFSANRESVHREEASVTQRFSAIMSAHSPDENGGHKWRMTPGHGSVLAGKPWDAAKTSLLTLQDMRSNRSLAPAVMLEVTCKRKDLLIQDFQLKDGNLWTKIKSRAGFYERKTAAEAFIKNRIEEYGLGGVDLTEPFATIRLAEVIATED